MITQTSKRLDVQGLRAVAVISVILFHANLPGFSNGFVGVDVFFVISGFVITGALARSEKETLRSKLNEFYRKRIIRIVPAATLTLLATAIATYYFLGAFSAVGTLEDIRWASFFSFNLRMINQGLDYFASSGQQFSTVLHFWSLSVEEQFYFVYPLLVLALIAISSSWERLAVWVIGVASVASLLLAFSYQSSSTIVAFYSPFSRAWEFGLGCLVAVLIRSKERLVSNAAIWSWVSSFVLLAAFLLTDMQPQLRLLLADMSAASIIYFGSSLTSNKKITPNWILSTKPFRYVGDISYSLYLWHYIWLAIPLQLAINGLDSTQITLSIAGATACAIASYYLLEKPIRYSKFMNKNNLAPYLILAFSLITVFATCYLLEKYWS